jgi:hypothetical protein
MNNIMSNDLQQAITHVLQQDSKVFSALIGKLKQHKQLQQILIEYLEPKLATHCEIANHENNCLIVLTDSALWATQFRFQIPELLTKLKQHPKLYDLKHIYCKIRPTSATRPTQKTPEPPAVQRLSSATAQMILDTASSIKHDKLKAIMQKIAKNTI